MVQNMKGNSANESGFPYLVANHLSFHMDSCLPGDVDIGPYFQGVPVLYMDHGNASIFLPVDHVDMIGDFFGREGHRIGVTLIFSLGLGEGKGFVVFEFHVEHGGRGEIHEDVVADTGVKVFAGPGFRAGNDPAPKASVSFPSRSGYFSLMMETMASAVFPLVRASR